MTFSVFARLTADDEHQFGELWCVGHRRCCSFPSCVDRLWAATEAGCSSYLQHLSIIEMKSHGTLLWSRKRALRLRSRKIGPTLLLHAAHFSHIDKCYRYRVWGGMSPTNQQFSGTSSCPVADRQSCLCRILTSHQTPYPDSKSLRENRSITPCPGPGSTFSNAPTCSASHMQLVSLRLPLRSAPLPAFASQVLGMRAYVSSPERKLAQRAISACPSVYTHTYNNPLTQRTCVDGPRAVPAGGGRGDTVSVGRCARENTCAVWLCRV
jgi:hypothetical protein